MPLKIQINQRKLAVDCFVKDCIVAKREWKPQTITKYLLLCRFPKQWQIPYEIATTKCQKKIKWRSHLFTQPPQLLLYWHKRKAKMNAKLKKAQNSWIKRIKYCTNKILINCKSLHIVLQINIGTYWKMQIHCIRAWSYSNNWIKLKRFVFGTINNNNYNKKIPTKYLPYCNSWAI